MRNKSKITKGKYEIVYVKIYERTGYDNEVIQQVSILFLRGLEITE